jgi:ketosteroid isomerase-like protein
VDTEIKTTQELDADAEEMIARCHAALLLQAQGRPEPFLELWSHTSDVALMAAIGGYQQGFGQVSEALSEASKSQNFESRDSTTLLAAFGKDLGVTVEVETLKRQIDGEPADLTVRATMVYRREAGEWKVIHRHGDILEPASVKW